MNRKGLEKDMVGLSTILLVFVAIIVGLILLQAVNPFIGDTTGANVIDVRNSTITMPTTGNSVALTGQDLITVYQVMNATNASYASVPATNYSITEGVTTNGVKGILFTSLGGNYIGQPVNVSYTAYPDGYIDNAGARSVTLLIPILMALALIVVALVPVIKNKLE